MDQEKPATGNAALRAHRQPYIVAGAVVGVATLMVLADLVQTIALGTGHVLVSAGGADPRLSLDALPQLFASGIRAGTVDALATTSVTTRLLFTLPALLHAAVVIVAAIHLLQITRGIVAGEPFSAHALGRWRGLAVTLICGGIAQMAADITANSYLTARIEEYYGVDRIPPESHTMLLGGTFAPVGANIPMILAGFVALALTVAFRAGAQLAEDADGLV